MAILSVRGIRKCFGDNGKRIEVLRDVAIGIEKGEMIAIVGPSGSGKTTLLNVMGNVIEPDDGEIYIEGHETSHLKDKERCRLRNQYLGYVVQDFALVEDETVEDNIMLPTQYNKEKVSAKVYKERMKLLAEEVRIAHKLKTKVKKLSGGERQRVAIARCQICNQQIILADEPTGALDQENSKIVMDFFQFLAKERNKAVVIVTHDQNVAARCDKIYRLAYGVLTEEKV